MFHIHYNVKLYLADVTNPNLELKKENHRCYAKTFNTKTEVKESSEKALNTLLILLKEKHPDVNIHLNVVGWG